MDFWVENWRFLYIDIWVFLPSERWYHRNNWRKLFISYIYFTFLNNIYSVLVTEKDYILMWRPQVTGKDFILMWIKYNKNINNTRYTSHRRSQIVHHGFCVHFYSTFCVVTEQTKETPIRPFGMSNPSENLHLSWSDFWIWPLDFSLGWIHPAVFGSLQSTHCSCISPHTIIIQEQPEKWGEE